MDLGQFETSIFETGCIAGSFAFNDFEKSDIFRKLGDIVAFKVGDSSILRTDNSMPAILFFGHHGVKAVFAVGMTAGREQPR